MVIKNERVDLSFSLMYGNFSIKISNTHGRRLIYKVSEKEEGVWVDIPYIASEYILKDFKQTENFKKMELIFNDILKDYGY